MELQELRHGQPLEHLLPALFESGLDHEEVADYLAISRVTLYDWMRRLKARVAVRRTVEFDTGTEEQSPSH